MLVKSQVKYIQSLGHKKFRDDEGVFIAEGIKLVNEILSEKTISPVMIFAVPDWIELYQKLIPENRGQVLFEISEKELGRISSLTTPNKVVCVFKKPLPGKSTYTNSVVLALDSIQDPGNLGTIIRIADWFGIGNIICSRNCTDAYGPKSVQSSMGSISRVNIHVEDLSFFVEEHKSLPLFLSSLQGKDITGMEPLTEGIIVIGNESKGVSESLFSLDHTNISIPGKGRAESLNAAVATGIILSHLIR